LLAAPRRATLFFNTLPLAANRLIARQLTRNAENLFEHKKYETITVAEQIRRVVFTREDRRYLPEEGRSRDGSLFEDGS
jgi:hypothetical protein